MSVILHIGQQRTGSTFLQRCVFSKIDFYNHGHFFVSDENIWSDIWSNKDDRWERLSVLKECFPDAKIILGIRETQSHLRSLYKKYISQGGTRTYSEMDSIINMKKLITNRIYIAELNVYFKHILIYKHKDLLCNPHQVIKAMCIFMDVPVPDYQVRRFNVGYGPVMLPFARQLNKLFRNSFNPSGLIPCHYYRLPHRFLYQEVLKR